MNWFELVQLISQGETNNHIFLPKCKIPSDLGPHICALANGRGGDIFIGMDLRNAHLIGTNLDAAWVEEEVLPYCQPRLSLSLDTITKHDKTVFHISVSTGEFKPYTFEDMIYIRSNAQTRMANRDERKMMEESLPASAIPETSPNSHHMTVQFIPFSKFQTHDTQKSLTLVSPNTAPPAPHQVETLKQNHEPTLGYTQEDRRWNDRQKNIVEYLQTHSAITNREYRKMFDISHKTAHLELSALCRDGSLGTAGAGRSTRYTLTQIPIHA